MSVCFALEIKSEHPDGSIFEGSPVCGDGLCCFDDAWGLPPVAVDDVEEGVYVSMHGDKIKSLLCCFQRRLVVHLEEFLIKLFACWNGIEKEIAVVAKTNVFNGCGTDRLVSKNKIRCSVCQFLNQFY